MTVFDKIDTAIRYYINAKEQPEARIDLINDQAKDLVDWINDECKLYHSITEGQRQYLLELHRSGNFI